MLLVFWNQQGFAELTFSLLGLQYKWWEAQAEGDGSSKWTTLEHNGVLFPPAYQPLPKNIRMKYDGKSVLAKSHQILVLTSATVGKAVTLSEEAEEVAGFFAALLETDHAADKTFRKNFFEDWLKVLKEHPSVCQGLSYDLACARELKAYLRVIRPTVRRSRIWRSAISDQCTNTLKSRRTRRSR